MIQMRAYEIYMMRGCQPGAEAQDWFHAEGEVLAFLIASEPAQTDASATTGDSVDEAAEITAPQSVPVKKKATTKPRSRRSAEGNETTRQSTASKRSSTKKPSKAKTKSVRSRNETKRENAE
jgi:hypothetical protein